MKRKRQLPLQTQHQVFITYHCYWFLQLFCLKSTSSFVGQCLTGFMLLSWSTPGHWSAVLPAGTVTGVKAAHSKQCFCQPSAVGGWAGRAPEGLFPAGSLHAAPLLGGWGGEWGGGYGPTNPPGLTPCLWVCIVHFDSQQHLRVKNALETWFWLPVVRLTPKPDLT